MAGRVSRGSNLNIDSAPPPLHVATLSVRGRRFDSDGLSDGGAAGTGVHSSEVGDDK